MKDQVKIRIPKVDEKKVATLSSGEIGNIKKKFEKIDQILFGVMLAVVLSLVAIIVSVTSLFLDQMRYNNAAYREYSEKIQTLDSAREANNELLKQNKQNQELILKQQNQILELLSAPPKNRR
ncbi:MAG: hypothetical protein AAB525_03975 [Patescibacteria group bacterium]